MNKVHFSSLTDEWNTPKSFYAKLDAEFHFNDDPCPSGGSGGLDRSWGSMTFCNPPYSQIKLWVEKAYHESLQGKTVVLLIPSRTDTRYWHDFIMKAAEIRFIKGRLKFNDSNKPAPFPSCVVVFIGI